MSMNRLAHATNGNPLMHTEVVDALLSSKYKGYEDVARAELDKLRDLASSGPFPPSAERVLGVLATATDVDVELKGNYKEEVARLSAPTGDF